MGATASTLVPTSSPPIPLRAGLALELRSAAGAPPPDCTAVLPIYPELVLRMHVAGALPPPSRAAAPVTLRAQDWTSADFNPVPLDAEVVRAAQAVGGTTPEILLRVLEVPGGAAGGTLALELATRYQRFIPGRNRHAASPLFDRVLAAHRDLHDVRLSLVAADHAHALDTWRWTVRLDPDASLAVQTAALFHDVERLESERYVRREQHADDYLQFKLAHARKGAELTVAVLTEIGMDAGEVTRVAELVAGHERLGADPELDLLNQADALSFFSINSCGFIAYYGEAHTRKKIAYTLDRLGPRGRAELGRLRLRNDIAALLAQQLADRPRDIDDHAASDAHATLSSSVATSPEMP
jgi:hypothetical protein